MTRLANRLPFTRGQADTNGDRITIVANTKVTGKISSRTVDPVHSNSSTSAGDASFDSPSRFGTFWQVGKSNHNTLQTIRPTIHLMPSLPFKRWLNGFSILTPPNVLALVIIFTQCYQFKFSACCEAFPGLFLHRFVRLNGRSPNCWNQHDQR